MSRARLKEYVDLAGDLLMLGLALFVGFLCLRALLTAEIGFGKWTRGISLYREPGWFWFAFWFQFALAVGVTVGCWFSVRRKFAALREKSRPEEGEPDA